MCDAEALCTDRHTPKHQEAPAAALHVLAYGSVADTGLSTDAFQLPVLNWAGPFIRASEQYYDFLPDYILPWVRFSVHQI
jgi:hypothetical protein